MKKWSIIALVILMLLVALRAWWGHEAHRRLNARIDAAHARGEKILVEDYASHPADDAENAAVALKAAAKAVVLTPPQEQWEDDFDARYAPSANDIAMMRAIVAGNRAALAKLRAARSMPVADFGVHVRSPAVNALLPHINDVHQLC